MSYFKLICEDEAMTFVGPSKLKQEFETVELSVILDKMTKFLRSTGYLDNNKLLTIERVIELPDLGDDDLDEYTENLFSGTPIPKE
jgi:hypothetical protein